MEIYCLGQYSSEFLELVLILVVNVKGYERGALLKKKNTLDSCTKIEGEFLF